MFFSKNIKYLRKSAGYGQAELAERLGVKANTISNYENSVSEPSIEQLQALIKIFDISIEKLLFVDLSASNEPLYAAQPPNHVAEPSPTYGKCDVCIEKDRTIAALQDHIALLKELLSVSKSQKSFHGGPNDQKSPEK